MTYVARIPETRTYVDARKVQCTAKYINHVCADPNAEFQVWTVEGEATLAIFSSRSINKHDEITITYCAKDQLWFRCECKSCCE
mmetsp:Transcript_8943/g.21157  ORF Transcript_8943/g.21157 Transcript_8943/m.21157 type:complete len:84 (+) Transcript_8943:1010-1261(+)